VQKGRLNLILLYKKATRTGTGNAWLYEKCACWRRQKIREEIYRYIAKPIELNIRINFRAMVRLLDGLTVYWAYSVPSWSTHNLVTQYRYV
jgi:hypothetical protein